MRGLPLSIDGWRACAALVEKTDTERFQSVMAAPLSARRRLFPIYAFNVEVARAPWVTQEPMIAEMRLQWWRDALAEIAGGATVRRHEIVTPLAQVLTPDQARTLDQLIEARRRDITPAPFDDRASFDGYIDATAGHLTWVSAAALGAGDARPVRQFAYGSGVAQYLRAVPELKARGRRPLFDESTEALAGLARDALAQLRQGRATGITPAARPALWAGWQAETILRQVVEDPRRVMAGALGLSGFRKHLGLLSRSVFNRI